LDAGRQPFHSFAVFTFTMRLLLIFLFVVLAGRTGAQVIKNAPGKELRIQKATGAIVLDGRLDEADWQQADVAKDFFLNFPTDSLPPQFQSEARLTFDDHHLYVSFVAYDDLGSSPSIVQSLRRDIAWELNDNMGIYIDPYNDFTSGFFFTLTPMGVQSEGIMSDGGATGDSFNDSWDNKWYSAVTRYDDRWIAEMSIPFKSFRYNQTSWNITFVRNDVKRNEVSSWIATPIAYIPASFSYAGKAVWAEPVPRAGMNVSLIPYTTLVSSRDDAGQGATFTQAGFDAKVAVTPALNLDLTVNPDFSNVEVDRQIINLTRFEFGFPELRQFFLENTDLFSQQGFPDTRPFFTRRLGLITDSSGATRPIPISYGARLSGKIGADWRIGLLNLQTRSSDAVGLPAQNYTVAVVQRQVFSRSNIGLVFINKQSLGLRPFDSVRFFNPSLIRKRIMRGDTTPVLNNFNRVAGADFNLFTKSNRWTGDFYYHRSMDNFSTGKNFSYGGFLSYTSRNFNMFLAQNGVGKNFNAEVGFVPLLAVYPGYHTGWARVETPLFPRSQKKIARMVPGVEATYTRLPDGTLTDYTYEGGYNIEFKNTAWFSVSYTDIFQRLPENFNPIFPLGDSTLLTGQQFKWQELRAEWRSDTRKLFNYSVNTTQGGFYNGTRTSFGGSINYRYQPFGSLSVMFDYADIRLPETYGRAQFLLIQPRLDLTFTDQLFLTAFLQYKDRFDNVNLNVRFQWRFKPASDFFVVYTENYFPDTFASKNRALVLKLTYWFNI
jgi:hypothetical protein